MLSLKICQEVKIVIIEIWYLSEKITYRGPIIHFFQAKREQEVYNLCEANYYCKNFGMHSRELKCSRFLEMWIPCGFSFWIEEYVTEQGGQDCWKVPFWRGMSHHYQLFFEILNLASKKIIGIVEIMELIYFSRWYLSISITSNQIFCFARCCKAIMLF